MARCGVKKGFFVLRDCLEITDTICPACRRACCTEHARAIGEPPGSQHCIECFARYKATGRTDATAEEAAASAAKSSGDLDYLDDSWSYGYRDRYYRGSGYRPIYHGSHHGTMFDDHDFRPFDHDSSDEIGFDDDGDPGGSLMDS